MFNNARYLTSGIDANVLPEVQLCLWHLIDTLTVQKDYLQVFWLSEKKVNGFAVQHIHHSQEVPPFSQDIDIIVDEILTCKIYVIDDGDHSTMLFAEEY